MERKKILVIEKEPKMMPRIIRFLKEKHDVQIVSSQEGLMNFKKTYEEKEHLQNGLEHYDCIIMEPYFSHHPRYTYEETDDAMQTGWFLYRDFMKDLPRPIAIWTYPTWQYMYGPNNHPDRKWGDNVIIIRKDGTNDYSLVELVELLCKKR
ncbi:MAG: hypothetical protein WC606_02345 [Candidatus Absconditabacterales bacterium]|jgi:hypothetical protein